MSESVAKDPNGDPNTKAWRFERLFSVWSWQYHLAILLCFLPLLILHFRQLWLYEHYQYFPLLLLAFPLIIQRIRVDEPVPRESGRSWEFPLIIAGLLIFALAVLVWSPNLAAVAFAVTSGGLLWHLYQRGQISRFFSCWFVLFFLIKLPFNIDVDLIFWLQGSTSELASRFLDFVGVNHVLSGHSLRIAEGDFLVEEACSGIQSLFALLATAALILAFSRRSLTHGVLLLAAAVFWACMINTIRVATVVLAFEQFGIDLTPDRPHEILGLVLFAAAIGLLISTDRMLLFFLSGDVDQNAGFEVFKTISGGKPIELPVAIETTAVATAAACERPADSGSGSRGSLILLGCFVTLGLIQLGIWVLTNRGLQSVNPDDPRMVELFNEERLPESIGRWTRKKFATDSRSLTNYLGRHSASWTYESDLGQAIVAIDFPFLGWHELTGCYAAQGCSVASRKIVSLGERAGAEGISATIIAPSGAEARLLFSEFMNDGRALLPLGSDAGTIAYWRSRLQSVVLRQFASFRDNASSYQVQLLYYFHEPPSDELERELLELHRVTSTQITDAVREATDQK